MKTNHCPCCGGTNLDKTSISPKNEVVICFDCGQVFEFTGTLAA